MVVVTRSKSLVSLAEPAWKANPEVAGVTMPQPFVAGAPSGISAAPLGGSPVGGAGSSPTKGPIITSATAPRTGSLGKVGLSSIATGIATTVFTGNRFGATGVFGTTAGFDTSDVTAGFGAFGGSAGAGTDGDDDPTYQLMGGCIPTFGDSASFSFDGMPFDMAAYTLVSSIGVDDVFAWDYARDECGDPINGALVIVYRESSSRTVTAVVTDTKAEDYPLAITGGTSTREPELRPEMPVGSTIAGYQVPVRVEDTYTYTDAQDAADGLAKVGFTQRVLYYNFDNPVSKSYSNVPTTIELLDMEGGLIVLYASAAEYAGYDFVFWTVQKSDGARLEDTATQEFGTLEPEFVAMSAGSSSGAGGTCQERADAEAETKKTACLANIALMNTCVAVYGTLASNRAMAQKVVVEKIGVDAAKNATPYVTAAVGGLSALAVAEATVKSSSFCGAYANQVRTRLRSECDGADALEELLESGSAKWGDDWINLGSLGGHISHCTPECPDGTCPGWFEVPCPPTKTDDPRWTPDEELPVTGGTTSTTPTGHETITVCTMTVYGCPGAWYE